MKISFTLTKKQVDQAFQTAIREAKKKTEIKGFRKGKAPDEMVIKAVGQDKLQTQAMEQALPMAYLKALDKEKIEPISYPKINLKSGKPGGDLEFEAEIDTKPEVDVSGYKKQLKGLLAKSEIWTPEKGDPDKQDSEAESREKKIEAVLDKLLETIEVEATPLLLEQEVETQMDQLKNRLKQLGLELKDYYENIEKSEDEVKKEIEANVDKQIKLEFILLAIAGEEKLWATEDEMKQLLDNIGSDEAREKLAKNPAQLSQLKVNISKQKVIDHLLEIAK